MLRFQIILATRYLWGRKLRSVLTTLAIIFGTLVIFSTNMMVPTMMEAFKTNLMAVSGQVDITITESSGEAFRSKILNQVRLISGIHAISPSLSRTVNIPEGYYDDARISALTLTGLDMKTAQSIRNYSILVGRFLRSSDSKVAVVTTSLAESLSLELGDTLRLPTTDGSVKLKIVGLLPERSMPGNEVVYVTLFEAQKLLDLPDRINTIELNLVSTEEEQREAIQKEIAENLGDNYTLGSMGSGSEIYASMKIAEIAFNLFGFLAMFMGGFIIYNTFRTIVAERRHDIGMLRALGANRKTIIGVILSEALVQGVVGTIVGIASGYLMGSILLLMLEQTFSQYLHLEIGAPVVNYYMVFITLFFGVGVSLLAGLLPALSASRVTPLEAMRPLMSEKTQSVKRTGTILGLSMIVLSLIGLASGNASITAFGGMLLLAGIVFTAPALVKPITDAFDLVISRIIATDGTGILARNNLERQPSRSAITASTTMVALAIIVGLGGMVWSLSGGFMDILRKSLGSDYLIMPPSVGLWKSNIGAKQDLGQKLSSVPGVAVVSTLRYAAGSVDGETLSLLGIDPQTYPQVASLTFQEGESQTAFLELKNGRSLIANGVFAARLGLKVGDIIHLSTPSGKKDYRVAAIAGDFLNAKILTAYISQDNMLHDFRKSEDIFYQLNLHEGMDSIEVERRLDKILEDYDQFKLISGKGYFEENEKMFNAVFAVYFVLLGAFSLPSLMAMLNTLSIGVIERTREIGMLRAIGATKKQIRRLVMAESLFLAGLGTLLGVFCGLYLGYTMVLGLSVTGFPVQYSFPTGAIIVATVAGIFFGIVAALLPASQAARMEIVNALRYE